MQSMHNAKKINKNTDTDTNIFEYIYVILKITDCGVISASVPRRWRMLNN